LEDVQLEEEVGMGGFKMDIRKVVRKVFVPGINPFAVNKILLLLLLCGTESCQKMGIHISGLNFLLLFLLGWLVCFSSVAWLID
jgi:hypothetical protein